MHHIVGVGHRHQMTITIKRRHFAALIGPNRAALFPALASDSTGHVGLALYGTPTAVDPDTAPNGTPWNVYYLESQDAAAANPSFTITNIEPDFHEGQICTSGINCGSNDRSARTASS